MVWADDTPCRIEIHDLETIYSFGHTVRTAVVASAQIPPVSFLGFRAGRCQSVCINLCATDCGCKKHYCEQLHAQRDFSPISCCFHSISISCFLSTRCQNNVNHEHRELRQLQSRAGVSPAPPSEARRNARSHWGRRDTCSTFDKHTTRNENSRILTNPQRIDFPLLTNSSWPRSCLLHLQPRFNSPA